MGDKYPVKRLVFLAVVFIPKGVMYRLGCRKPVGNTFQKKAISNNEMA